MKLAFAYGWVLLVACVVCALLAVSWQSWFGALIATIYGVGFIGMMTWAWVEDRR